LLSADEGVKKESKDPWVEDCLKMVDEMEEREGRPPLSPQVRKEALGLSDEQMEAAGMLTEEVATLRMLLRNVYQRAQQDIETREYLRLVDLYGHGCYRLARMLRLGGGDDQGRLERYLRAAIDEAIREVNQEFMAESEAYNP